MENGNMINKKEGVRLRAVAFDMDGVLLSTDKLHFKAWQEFTHRHGIPFTEADNARLLGLSRMDSMNIVLSRAQRAYSTGEKHLKFVGAFVCFEMTDGSLLLHLQAKMRRLFSNVRSFADTLTQK